MSKVLVRSPHAQEAPSWPGRASLGYPELLLTQRRVIDHGRRTTTGCRREM
ncbi:hypothetical protein [Saccharopolyspora taberi]|uniref:hypothetical protein n=1 Tax=Saccharopolyspora taberi TaxID=60895 RepID=UPI0031DCC030